MAAYLDSPRVAKTGSRMSKRAKRELSKESSGFLLWYRFQHVHYHDQLLFDERGIPVLVGF